MAATCGSTPSFIGAPKLDSIRGPKALTQGGHRDALVAFTNIMSSRSAHLASPYFSDNVVLDWFGRTVLGKDNVLRFLFEELQISSHDVVEVKSRQDDIQKKEAMARAIGRFRQSPDKKDYDSDMDDDSGFGSGIFSDSDSSFCSEGSLTPCSKMASELSRLRVSGFEHHAMPLHAAELRTPLTARITRAPTMLKRPAMIVKSLKQLEVPKNIRFMDAAGVISAGPLQNDIFNPEPIRPWSKHCHIQIGYHHAVGGTICLSFLLYNDEMPCRKNLSKIFDLCD